MVNYISEHTNHTRRDERLPSQWCSLLRTSFMTKAHFMLHVELFYSKDAGKPLYQFRKYPTPAATFYLYNSQIRRKWRVFALSRLDAVQIRLSHLVSDALFSDTTISSPQLKHCSLLITPVIVLMLNFLRSYILYFNQLRHSQLGADVRLVQ